MAFYPCTNNEIDRLIDGSIQKIYSPVTKLRTNDFYDCTSLTDVNLPNVEDFNNSAFRGCSSLINVTMPSAKILRTGVFQDCTSLTYLDAYDTNRIDGSAFLNTKLNVLILRGNYVCTLGIINAFTNTQFDTSGTGGTLYVPQALIASYQANATWASLLSQNPNNQILAIEGSPYEN